MRTETTAAGAVELHHTSVQGDVVHVVPLSEIGLPPGETIVLEPGGLHMMLANLVSPLRPEDRLLLTLTFERAGEAEVEVAVGEP